MSPSNPIEENLEFRIKRTSDALARWLRSCAICGSVRPPIDLLCEMCWCELERRARRESLYRGEYSFPVYSLFEWNHETDAWLRPLLEAFKGGWSVRGGMRLSTLFLQARTRHSSFSGRLVIPAPGRGFDHAAAWAFALSNQCDLSCENVLQDAKTPGRKQKEKRADERSQRRFVLKKRLDEGAVVFADDIITTGSTAMAAYMALGDPKDFEVWTLAFRPRLATLEGL